MKKHCMVTCEVCNLKPSEASISKIQPPPQQPQEVEDPVPEMPEAARTEVHGIQVQPKVDPTVAQQLWKAGTYRRFFLYFFLDFLFLFALRFLLLQFLIYIYMCTGVSMCIYSMHYRNVAGPKWRGYMQNPARP